MKFYYTHSIDSLHLWKQKLFLSSLKSFNFYSNIQRKPNKNVLVNISSEEWKVKVMHSVYDTAWYLCFRISFLSFSLQNILIP